MEITIIIMNTIIQIQLIKTKFMSNKILVTGAAGFIGFNLIKSFFNDDLEIIGIDNLNDYYDVELKKARLKILLKNKKFNFYKIDIILKRISFGYFPKISIFACYSSCSAGWC